jgi:hypothetical protein
MHGTFRIMFFFARNPKVLMQCLFYTTRHWGELRVFGGEIGILPFPFLSFSFRSLPFLPPFPTFPFPSSLPPSLPFPFPPPTAAKRPPYDQLGGLGERCELPQRVRAEPGRQTVLLHL